jgi:hypothetical protein
MNTKVVLSPRLYFSYSQFMVYDQSVRLPGCEWTDRQSAQGFARRVSTVNFNTLLEFGYADVTISPGPFEPSEGYQRVIAVPFLVTSGKVVVDGPEETSVQRNFALPPGNYRLVAAQRVITEEKEAIDLFFEPLTEPLERSSILVADKALTPLTHLIENARIAGEEE